MTERGRNKASQRRRKETEKQQQSQREAVIQAPQGPSSLFKGAEQGLPPSIHPSSLGTPPVW